MKLLPRKTPGADLFAALGSVDVSQGAQEESVCAGRAAPQVHRAAASSR